MTGASTRPTRVNGSGAICKLQVAPQDSVIQWEMGRTISWFQTKCMKCMQVSVHTLQQKAERTKKEINRNVQEERKED